MKRLILLLIFLIAYPVNAGWYYGATDFCSDMGASGTYKGWWNGDYSGDTDKMCVNSGTSAKDGQVISATIDTWSNFSISGPAGGGTYGVKVDADDEYVSWAISSLDVLNTSEGTIALDLYLIASTGANAVFCIYQDADNWMAARITSGNAIYFRHEGNNQNVNVTGGDPISDTTWTEVRMSWSVTSNQISVKVGANAWDDDIDVTVVTAFSVAAETLRMGVGVCGDAVVDGVYMDNFRTSGTYKDEDL